MTPEQRAAEAEQASVAFHIALTQIGAATIEDALKLWAGMPPTATAQATASWLSNAVRLILTRRGQARALATAYYRLVRALRTGRTVADPRKLEPAYVSLALLRREFKELAAQKPLEGGESADPTEDTSAPAQGSDEPQAGQDSTLNEDRIPVEKLDGNSTAEAERLERLAAQEARTDLIALGPKNLLNKLKDIDTDAPAKEVDALREEARKQAGARQASAVERVVLDGARGTIWNYSSRDRRAIGYIRLSRTGTPCGWCAMLISRGAVYKSKTSATFSEGDQYHDNCHCYAEPVFSKEQYNSSPLYELNRRYQELWPEVTEGLSGKAAVSAWRAFIRREQDQLAREARRTRAQEA